MPLIHTRIAPQEAEFQANAQAMRALVAALR